MLTAIREKASSLVVKILFGFLVASFAVWGIGDIFRGGGHASPAIEVGDIAISPQTLQQLSELLDALRQDASLVERTPGAFYRRSKAFLHFHEDPAGIFADAGTQNNVRAGQTFPRLL